MTQLEMIFGFSRAELEEILAVYFAIELLVSDELALFFANQYLDEIEKYQNLFNFLKQGHASRSKSGTLTSRDTELLEQIRRSLDMLESGFRKILEGRLA